MEDSLRLDLLNVFAKHGIVSENSIRNELIKNEFLELKEKGLRPKDAREQLSDKYFLGLKSIEKIIYEK